MNGTYNTGIDANNITLEVQVGTPAVSYTSADLILSTSEKKIAESSADNPNIPQLVMGTALELHNGGVVVTTNLDLTHIPTAQRADVVKALVHKTIIGGGVAGAQSFTPDADDIVANADNSNVVVTKAVKFT